VVVSTATKSLQEQLRQRPAPRAHAAGRPIPAAVVKGRGNYLCRAQLAVAGGRVDPADAGGAAPLGAWIDATRTGDRTSSTTCRRRASGVS
jgi:ATP-dependent DNA helicase DinG